MNKALCIDLDNGEDIYSFLHQEGHWKRFQYIKERILSNSNRFFKDYQKLDNGLTEMRFFANGSNGRIYCREVVINGTLFCIVLAKALTKKKSQAINKTIQQLIDSIKKYEYEIAER